MGKLCEWLFLVLVTHDLFYLQNEIYIWLVSTFFLWFVLAIYFDNIIPNSSGVRKSMFYFLYPGYWTGKGGDKVTGS